VSQTPRTDAAFRSAIREANDSAEPLNEMIGFSMKLERELNAAQQHIKRLEDIINRASLAFFSDSSHRKVSIAMHKILEEFTREVKP